MYYCAYLIKTYYLKLNIESKKVQVHDVILQNLAHAYVEVNLRLIRCRES